MIVLSNEKHKNFHPSSCKTGLFWIICYSFDIVALDEILGSTVPKRTPGSVRQVVHIESVTFGYLDGSRVVFWAVLIIVAVLERGLFIPPNTINFSPS